VVDGFQGGDLTSLNPNDIESMEVLKDASATAIYGAKGANGVILIQTKRGRSTKPRITYSADFGVSIVLMGGVKLMNAADYARETNFYNSRNNYDYDPIPIFTDEEIAEFERTGGTNWMDVVYRQALTQTHQLSVERKVDNLAYYVSGQYYNQEGVLLASGYDRYSLRANLNSDITNWLKFGLTWYGALETRFGAAFDPNIDPNGNPIYASLNYAPTLPIYDEEGNYSKANPLYGHPTAWNPLASAIEPDSKRQNVINNANLFLDFNILEGLTLRVQGSARLNNAIDASYYNTKTYGGYTDNGVGTSTSSFAKNLQNSNILTYKLDKGKHNFQALGVGEIQYSETFITEIYNKDFIIQETGYYSLGGSNIQKTNSSHKERKLVSFLGKLNYSFDNRYLTSFSLRADGSSVFGRNHKWGYFPAGSLGWRVSEEKFLKGNKLISNLMFRSSFGVTGNQAIGSYQTLSRIAQDSAYPWDGGDGAIVAYTVNSSSNPNLKWESTIQRNLGFDIALLKNQLEFTAEVFRKNTTDMLLSRELPLSSGLTSITDNVGSMETTGWEVSFKTNGIRLGNLRWSSSLNLSSSSTIVLDLGTYKFLAYSAGSSGGGVGVPFKYLTVGEPFGQFMGFKYIGLWQEGEEEEAGRYGQRPGNARYEDVNADGKIDFDNDWQVIGNSTPDLILGWSNDFSYKRWNLSFLFQGTIGNDIFNVSRIQRESASTGVSTDRLKRWTYENQNTDIPAVWDTKSAVAYRDAWNATHPDQPYVSTYIFPTSGGNLTSRWLEDGSYIRLKNIQLSYNFPSIQGISNLRLSVSCTNVFTLTKYKGFDPEVSSYTTSAAHYGTDTSSYPQARTVNFALNITL
jgi:TonB-linked SusC/RagA family outer membrane protein